MSELISRTALLAEYDKHHVGAPGGARKLIEDAPTIDAVPVDKIHFTDLYLDGREAIAVFKFGNQGITLRKKCEDFAPVVHGRWEFVDDYTGRCTNCREENGIDWENEDNYCPNCGNRDQSKLNVARRTCGYIGSQFWNQGRTQEIRDRVLHL